MWTPANERFSPTHQNASCGHAWNYHAWRVLQSSFCNRVLYLWVAGNHRIAPAQLSCAGFRKFSEKKFMHRARAARPRGFDSLPSLSDVGTLSFRWILPFWYFCFLLAYKPSLALYPVFKQKYQKGFIHRKLRVQTSEREGKLSNPRGRAARAMHGENLRKFTETRARPPRALCTDFLVAKYTVPKYLDLIIKRSVCTKFSRLQFYMCIGVKWLVCTHTVRVVQY
jgi:hypothetical protein